MDAVGLSEFVLGYIVAKKPKIGIDTKIFNHADHGMGVDANGNNTPQRDDDDRINWEELEHSSQEHRQQISSQGVGALIVTDSNLGALVKASE